MAIGPNMAWRIRTDGDNANGGGFDPTVSGAGTDYTDQATAQLSLTDVVTNGTSTVTSATGGFTSAMIGNVIRIATKGYYPITARTNTNTITVDGSPSSGTGLSAKVGGAFGGFDNFVSGGNHTMPSLTNPLVAGNAVFIRGNGEEDPSTVQYPFTTYWSSTNGDMSGNGRISFIGYNGRPLIGHAGLWLYDTSMITITNMSFKLTGDIYSTYGAVYAGGVSVVNCIFEQNGYNIRILTCPEMINCIFRNTPSNQGSNPGDCAIWAGGHPAIINGCSFVNLRNYAVRMGPTSLNMTNCIFNNCQSDCVRVDESDYGYPSIIENNTFNNPTGHAIYFVEKTSMAVFQVRGNIFSNITGSGKSAVYTPSSSVRESDRYTRNWDWNVFYNNTTHLVNVNYGDNDSVDVNPNYANSGSGDFTPTNAILAGRASPISLFSATNNKWPGAIQPSGGGGFTLSQGLHPIESGINL